MKMFVSGDTVESEVSMPALKVGDEDTGLINALERIGLVRGDVVMVYLADIAEDDVLYLLYSVIREVVGEEGTILIPAFSMAFCKDEEFNSGAAPGQPDLRIALEVPLDRFRDLPRAVVSEDPILPVIGLGPRAEEILLHLPNTCYGTGCVYERLMLADGKICAINAGIGETSFVHYVEEAIGVPYRYKKLFTNQVDKSGRHVRQGWCASVAIDASNGSHNGGRLEVMARSEEVCREVTVGSDKICLIDCRTFYALIARESGKDSRGSAKEPERSPVELEDPRIGDAQESIQLPQNASMEQMIAALWMLPRDIVSDGYDVALRALSTQAPMTIHEYPTGTECWTWLVPEKWTCKEAWLETLDGRRLFAYADNPLHVVSYSLAIDREVSRHELFEHLHTHPILPDAIPFVFKYYERDWGLCCSERLKASLKDDRYRVVVRSEFSYGKLKVGEVVVRGRSNRSFVLCAHLCHPAMVNDDLSGVVVGMKVMQELLERNDLRYTYRFLILPETIGSIAYLSHHEQLIPEMIGGLFLEMLGLENPHALQLSFSGETEMDRCLSHTLAECDQRGWTGAFRTVVGNDERQFNAPGVRVPMLSLSRVRRERERNWPYYPEYHSSFDTPELASAERLVESQDLVLKMIDGIEQNRVPINHYKGEIFCSRYGLNIDAYGNPEGNKALFDIIFLIDGTRSVVEIARLCKVSIESVNGVIDRLVERGLVECDSD